MSDRVCRDIGAGAAFNDGGPKAAVWEDTASLECTAVTESGENKSSRTALTAFSLVNSSCVWEKSWGLYRIADCGRAVASGRTPSGAWRTAHHLLRRPQHRQFYARK